MTDVAAKWLLDFSYAFAKGTHGEGECLEVQISYSGLTRSFRRAWTCRPGRLDVT